ncbi:unnamed protein product [Sphenostylis stenocarpa]|uniref:Multifunctional fusion protein n=1 Tax=Sphenostylis stenocarpa TaxID=92480 RepID=A0AA86SED5_9FABA|nr:unnamed protein product [Sphenostylis stenocarpa]
MQSHLHGSRRRNHELFIYKALAVTCEEGARKLLGLRGTVSQGRSEILNSELESEFRFHYLPQFYHSLPPITKAYGTVCVLATATYHLGLYDLIQIALLYERVFYGFQAADCLGRFFTIKLSIRGLLLKLRYGVQLEQGPFDRRTADFLWMMIFGSSALLVLSAIPFLWSPFLAVPLVFMLLYVWSREFPNAQINIYGLVALKAFYLPWAMLALDVIFGSPLIPDLLGIIAGHLYYFLTVLHPLAGGKNILKTPMWVYPYGFLLLKVLLCAWAVPTAIRKLVGRWRIGMQPISRAQPANNPQQESGAGVVFRGRSYRLGAKHQLGIRMGTVNENRKRKIERLDPVMKENVIGWQELNGEKEMTYVDEHLMCDIDGTGHHLTAAAIIGHDGSVWAQSTSFPQIKSDEVSGIMKDFDEPGYLAPTGLHLSGTKYMVIQGEPGAVIRGKKGSGGITIKKTDQALVFGLYDEPVTPGQCNMVVERLGDYLIDQGL